MNPAYHTHSLCKDSKRMKVVNFQTATSACILRNLIPIPYIQRDLFQHRHFPEILSEVGGTSKRVALEPTCNTP